MNELPAACTLLVRELGELRARRGISLAGLAAETPYSKSSWARYLNGKALPPLQAVQELCALAGEPDTRLRALWAAAEAAWSRRDAVAVTPAAVQAAAPDPAIPDESTPPDSRRHGWSRTAVIVACVLLGAAVAGLFGLRGFARTTASAAGTTPTAPGTISGTGVPVGCQGRACDGRDPGVMDCGIVPQSLGTFQMKSGATLEFRYNARCESAWVRVWNSAAGDQLSSSAGADSQSAVVPNQYAAATFFYTPMVPSLPDGPALQACLKGASGQKECESVPQP